LVQQKRKRKYRLLWLASFAGVFLLGIIWAGTTFIPNPQSMVLNPNTSKDEIAGLKPKQSPLHSSQAEKKPMAVTNIPKKESKLKSNVVSEPLNKRLGHAKTKAKPALGSSQISSGLNLAKKGQLPLASKSELVQAKTPEWKEEAPKFSNKPALFTTLIDSLERSPSNSHAVVCEQIIIPDSVWNAKTFSFKNKWFVGMAFTQNLYNTQQAYNSKSLLVFGDSSEKHDKAISTWRFDVYAGSTLGDHWYWGAGCSFLKTRFASITKAEQETSALNLSITGADRRVFLTDAAYFDETLSYLFVPIHLGYRINMGKWQLSAELGPQFNCLIKTGTYKASPTIGEVPEQLQDANNVRFNKYTFALHQRATLSYPIAKNCYIGLGLQLMQNLANTYSSDYYTDHKARMAGLQLGIKYYLP
jgi:hypothetical protein